MIDYNFRFVIEMQKMIISVVGQKRFWEPLLCWIWTIHSYFDVRYRLTSNAISSTCLDNLKITGLISFNMTGLLKW